MLKRYQRNALLSGAAVLLALAAMFVAAATFQIDVRNWNTVCGARVRTYDPSFAAQLTVTGFSGRLPLLAELLLILAVPPIFTRSLRAHWASLILMITLVLLLGMTALSLSQQDYYYECYRGGHENGPGDVGWAVLASVAFVALLNLFVVAVDWLGRWGKSS